MRDPEADRYELQAQRERQEELGRALYEKRRPNAPKAWAELDEDDQMQWILIAIDQQGAVDTRQPVPLCARMVCQHPETAHTRGPSACTQCVCTAWVSPELPNDPAVQRQTPTEGFGANGYPVAHASNAVPVDSSVPDLAEKLRRVWLGGKPFEPGGRIDWTRFAEALITDEGVRPR